MELGKLSAPPLTICLHSIKSSLPLRHSRDKLLTHFGLIRHLAQVQGYTLSGWLLKCSCHTAGPHCSTFTEGTQSPQLRQYPEGTQGPHCGNIRRALNAAISGAHPRPSMQQYPKGTQGPHCSNIRRAPRALIMAISGGHPRPSLQQYSEGTH